jgi:hypothetical protein
MARDVILFIPVLPQNAATAQYYLCNPLRKATFKVSFVHWPPVESTIKAACPSSSGEPHGRFWWVGLVILIFIGVVAAGKIFDTAAEEGDLPHEIGERAEKSAFQIRSSWGQFWRFPRFGRLEKSISCMFSTPVNIPIPSAGTIIPRINTAYFFIKKLAGREILRN